MLYDKRWETKPEDKWRQVLLDAADILEENGWCQFYSLREGRYCAAGAIVMAEGLAATTMECFPGDFYNERRAFGRMQLALGCPVMEWNDELGRTKEEVIAKLREVAHAA